MSKDAVWSYKVPGVHCAILAELSCLYTRGMFFTMGILENIHNQLIVISLIVLSYYMVNMHFHNSNNKVSIPWKEKQSKPAHK